MTRLYDELRDAIAGRIVENRFDAQGRRFDALSVRFSRPIPPVALSALAAEVPHTNGVRIPGTASPIAVELSPNLVNLIFEPIDPATLRLDTLLSALTWSGSPLGSPLSAYVVVLLCRALSTLHATMGADGLPRIHREVHAGTILVDPGGQLRLFGAGLPTLTAVMVPRRASQPDRDRILAPEAARGEPLDPRADVFSAGVLYYELLSGHRYRGELPGALPDPRRQLVDVLSRALAFHRDQRFPSARALGEAVAVELADARIALPGGSMLERMVDEFVPAGVERGVEALLRSEHDPAQFEALMSGVAETITSPPAEVRIPNDAPTAPAPPAVPDAWSSILGEGPPASPPPPPSLPSPPNPSGEARTTSLPLPPADPAQALSLPTPPPLSGPTKPLSGEHLAALASRPASTRPRSSSKASPEPEGTSTPVRIAIGLAAIALVGAVGFGLKARPSEEQTPVDPDLTTTQVFAPDAAEAVPQPAADAAVEERPIGLLTVLSKPSGAAVEVDGGYVGKTPLVMRHEFQDRPYNIKVLADGHLPWEQTAYPDANRAISVMAVLEKKE